MFWWKINFCYPGPCIQGVVLPDGQKVLLVDTVGFIDKLPHDLVEAFHSTLEEVVEADLLLHVVDASSENLAEQIMVVKRVLRMLGANQQIITVFNKMDLVQDATLLPAQKPQAYISAKTGEGLEQLLKLIQENIPKRMHRVTILLPYEQGNLRSMLHEEGTILSEEFVPEGIHMEVEVDEVLLGRIKNYLKVV